MCLGQRRGYHGCGPGRAGVYAAQHAAGGECVPRGATAGRHVPAQRDGKNQSQCFILTFRAVGRSVAGDKNDE